MASVLHIELPIEVAAQIERQMRPGFCYIGKITREEFTGANFQTSGRIYLELGPVPESALPALRKVVAEARERISNRKPKA